MKSFVCVGVLFLLSGMVAAQETKITVESGGKGIAKFILSIPKSIPGRFCLVRPDAVTLAILERRLSGGRAPLRIRVIDEDCTAVKDGTAVQEVEVPQEQWDIESFTYFTLLPLNMNTLGVQGIYEQRFIVGKDGKTRALPPRGGLMI